MIHFLRQLLPTQAATRKPQPRTSRPRFRPAIERLDDRITPTLGFGTATAFTVGTRPYGVAVGDLNGDGRIDVVSTNEGAGAGTTVSVLVNTTPNGTATPTFAAKQDFTVGTQPNSVVIADLNGDGRADIATNNFGAATVSVLLNTTPTGAAALSFAAKQDFPVGTNPVDLDVGDFNSDGRLDLVSANYGAASVSVLLNTTPMQAGLATFAAQTTFATGTSPDGIAVGDFNGDGRIDIAIANSGAASVSVLLNTTASGATPTFAAKQDFTVGTQPRLVAVGDFNGDGRLDLATACSGANSVSVLLNATAAGSATPTFAAQQTFAVGTTPYGIAVGDFDGDGRADIATTNVNSDTASVLLNATVAGSATPTFAAQQTFAVGTSPYGIAVGDFKGDGRADFVTANYGSAPGTTVSVVANTSTNVLPTTTSPALVVQVGTLGGVAAYKRDTGTWVTLTGANANALAASASGNVIASFGGNGVYYYRAAGQTWTKINGIQAVAVAIDPLGNAYISFAGYGTFMYRLATSAGPGGGFELITGAVANILAASANGDVIGNFPGFGIYRYQRTAAVPFYQINGFNADSLAVDRNGYVAAAFGGFGVGQYIPYALGWRTVAPAVAATAVAFDGSGNVYASIPGFGVGKFDYTNTWKNLAPGVNATSLAADWSGNVFASFAGWPGVWEYNPSYGWQWKFQSAVTLVSLAA